MQSNVVVTIQVSKFSEVIGYLDPNLAEQDVSLKQDGW